MGVTRPPPPSRISTLGNVNDYLAFKGVNHPPKNMATHLPIRIPRRGMRSLFWSLCMWRLRPSTNTHARSCRSGTASIRRPPVFQTDPGCFFDLGNRLELVAEQDFQVLVADGGLSSFSKKTRPMRVLRPLRNISSLSRCHPTGGVVHQPGQQT